MTTPVRWIRDRAGRRGTGALTLGLAALLLASGCSKPPPPPPPPPPKKTAPPPPEPVDAQALVQSMHVDARVEFAPDEAPANRGLAEAAIRLADAIAKGDDKALAKMLDKGNQQILQRLKSTDQWSEATSGIEAVRVVSIDGAAKSSDAPESAQVVLAVQDPDGAYVLPWAGKKVFDDWVFSAVPGPDEERARASAWDGMSPASAGGGAGLASLFASDPELQDLFSKAMSDPESMSVEDLQKLLDALKASGAVPEEMLTRLQAELDKLKGEKGQGDEGEGEGGFDRGGGGG